MLQIYRIEPGRVERVVKGEVGPDFQMVALVAIAAAMRTKNGT